MLRLDVDAAVDDELLFVVLSTGSIEHECSGAALPLSTSALLCHKI